MESIHINTKKCTRCNKILSLDNFKIKPNNEYNKQCITCREKAKLMPSKTNEAYRARYAENRENEILRKKLYRDKLPITNCECGSSFKSYKLNDHLKTKVHTEFLKNGLTEEEQQKNRYYESHEKRSFCCRVSNYITRNYGTYTPAQMIQYKRDIKQFKEAEEVERICKIRGYL